MRVLYARSGWSYIARLLVSLHAEKGVMLGAEKGGRQRGQLSPTLHRLQIDMGISVFPPMAPMFLSSLVTGTPTFPCPVPHYLAQNTRTHLPSPRIRPHSTPALCPASGSAARSRSRKVRGGERTAPTTGEQCRFSSVWLYMTFYNGLLRI